ncbi:hypothetical protein OG897_21750 [Streptomyces sp. NBC_00237]|uniref:hypothetical protein n=1 Tax=Streptomyces sp. NBC_00237 TaxID=2975687 RepID=UPI00225797D4|nr:hypothetical protein [Streptomyces sp. NBC_00237]MCX5204064.1 hypothetical protein [Streptomyces sp. NBC_00237]
MALNRTAALALATSLCGALILGTAGAAVAAPAHEGRLPAASSPVVPMTPQQRAAQQDLTALTEAARGLVAGPVAERPSARPAVEAALATALASLTAATADPEPVPVPGTPVPTIVVSPPTAPVDPEPSTTGDSPGVTASGEDHASVNAPIQGATEPDPTTPGTTTPGTTQPDTTQPDTTRPDSDVAAAKTALKVKFEALFDAVSARDWSKAKLTFDEAVKLSGELITKFAVGRIGTWTHS